MVNFRATSEGNIPFTEEEEAAWQAEQDAWQAEAPAAAAQALQASIIAATQVRLDMFAKTRNYDGILSAATYATSAIPKFAAEGQAAVAARDQTWAALYALMGEVQAGALPMPASFDEVEALLPTLAWPV
jgi:hypothetical protein